MQASEFERVLVVEDDHLQAMALEGELVAAGAKDVRVYSTIAEAMPQIAAFQPQLLILDVHLADRDDGWGLAEIAMQLCNPTPRIVFSTGAPDMIPARLRDGADVMAKPYDPRELVRMLSGPKRGSLRRKLGGLISGKTL